MNERRAATDRRGDCGICSELSNPVGDGLPMCEEALMNKQIPSDLDTIAKTVLAYHPPQKEKATKRREKKRLKRAAKSG